MSWFCHMCLVEPKRLKNMLTNSCLMSSETMEFLHVYLVRHEHYKGAPRGD